VILDTRQHVDYFVETFGLPAAKFSALPVGCSDAIYAPQPYTPEDGPLRVLSYSSYLPLHGIDIILRAAAALRTRDDVPALHFRLIGDGTLLPAMQRLAQELALDNVEFMPPVSQPQLAKEIAAADICLGGHFHDSCKAGRVIPGKIYQMLAVGRPVIAADTPANRELLTADTTALMVSPSSPEALADGIRRLAADGPLRARLAQAGRALYAARAAQPVITQQLEDVVRRMSVQADG
jgi:glycosyltransferase involved in cell wall biosynthesis